MKERGHWILATDYNDDQNDISMWCDEYVNIDIRKLNGKYHNVLRFGILKIDYENQS